MHCLDPPLEEVPEGDWFCQVCADRPKSPSKPGRHVSCAASAANYLGPGKLVDADSERYLVKWCGLPYSECTWETEASLCTLINAKGLPAWEMEFARYQRFNEPRDTTVKGKRGGKTSETSLATAIEQLTSNLNGDQELRNYQQSGVQWLCFNWHSARNSILADEMGLVRNTHSRFTHVNVAYISITSPSLTLSYCLVPPAYPSGFSSPNFLIAGQDGTNGDHLPIPARSCR
jgi:hypothetical protein